MVKGTQVKKEEAEFRKLAKEHRQNQKVAKLQAKKQLRREQAKAKTTDSDGEPSPAQLSRRRNAIIVLPSEVEALRQRLASKKTISSKKEGSAVKKTAKKNSRKEADGTASGTNKIEFEPPTPGDTVPLSASPAMGEVPNYHWEIHFKRKMMMVDVVLHRIPPQKVNVSETTSSTLVVSTEGHTKKYRLVLPMPNGLRIDAEAENAFELENGVLHCRLPFINEDIPVALQHDWEALQERIRLQRAQRFTVDKDGELTVRTRRALLPADLRTEEKLQQALEEEKMRKMKARGSGRGAAEADLEEASGEASEAPQLIPNDELISEKVELSAATKSKTNAKGKAAKKDSFLKDQERAKQIAAEAAKKVRQTIAERVQKGREQHQHRLAKLQEREKRQVRKDDRREKEFKRILEEQKEKVLAELKMQADAEADREARLAARQSKDGSKGISFAE